MEVREAVNGNDDTIATPSAAEQKRAVEAMVSGEDASARREDAAENDAAEDDAAEMDEDVEADGDKEAIGANGEDAEDIVEDLVMSSDDESDDA